ncbi:MAG TPA: GNAT family N-acetyltransferase [Polyangiaceae bacterium]|nr:GNAT family N-acetyltransferase [Polyangiaceae bacterium]
MATVDVSPLGLDDLEAVASLYVQTFNAPPWSEGWSIEAASERLEGILGAANGLGVLASRQGTPIAFALGYLEQWVSGAHFQLKEMCTAPAEQRQGVGTFLLDSLLSTLKERGVIQVFCETRAGVPAEAFYRRAGFRALNVVALGKRL